MQIQLLLLAALLVAGALAAKSYARRHGLDWQRLRIRLLMGGLIALLILLMASGRLHWLLALLGSAFAFLRATLPYAGWVSRLARGAGLGGGRSQGAAGGPAGTGGQSQVRTRYLRMYLDHASGEMDGEILEGARTGRRLSSLSEPELMSLLRECRARDPDSAQLLETFLDRRLGPGWRQGQSDDPGRGGPLSREQALRILGLDAAAGREEILAAYRRLMQRVHPDRGGSSHLAEQINEAKRVLLD